MIIGKPLTVGGAKGLEPTILVNSITGSTISCDGVTGTEKAKPNPAYRNLPSGYTQLESLSANADAWLNLGRVPTASSSFKYKYWSTVADKHIGGCAYYYLPRLQGGNLLVYARCSTQSTYSYSHTMGDKFETEAYVDNNKIKVNGTELTSASAGSNTPTSNLYLFTYEGQSSWAMTGGYEYFEWYESGTLVMDLVPCKRNADSVVSMYDMVSNTFITPTGTFTGGDIVPATLPYWEFKTTIGTHTIVGQYNGITKTETVLVDSVGLYSVTITYRTYLYNLGDECEELTGGWTTTTSGGTATKNTTNIYLKAYRSSIYTMSKVDFTNYSKLKIHYTSFKGRTGNTGKGNSSMNLGGTSTLSYVKYGSWTWGRTPECVYGDGGLYDRVSYSNFTVELDISNISQSLYIGTTIDDSDGVAEGYIDKIWLE